MGGILRGIKVDLGSINFMSVGDVLGFWKDGRFLFDF